MLPSLRYFISAVAVIAIAASCERELIGPRAHGAASASVVPEEPPNSEPTDLAELDSLDATGQGTILWHKSLIELRFVAGATQADKQHVVDSIGGQVVGGRTTPGGSKIYYVRVASNTAGTAAGDAAALAESLPGVAESSPITFVTADGLAYRSPFDGAGWRQWQLDPGHLSGAAQHNWQLEALDLPRAWGCSIGDSVHLAVVDSRIHVLTEHTNIVGTPINPDPNTPVFSDVLTWHGDAVTRILASPGDDNVGMTGVMWHAGVSQTDITEYPIVPGTSVMRTNFVADVIEFAVGVPEQRVINISLGSGIDATRPVSAADSIRAATLGQAIVHGLARAHAIVASTPGAHMPLVVVAAGNGGGDARWSGYPQAAADPTYGRYVLVVTASAYSTTSTAPIPSYAGVGSLVEIAAPGDNVWVTDAALTPRQISGTSFAAPAVSGIAGLLFAFDPSLTADSVKQLLLAGATAGGRVATSGGATYPVANAYEALRIAAVRAQSPLCGNRVWITDAGAVQVQRGTATETIGSAGYPGDYLYVPHGGRQVVYSTDDGDGLYAFDYDTSSRSWVQHADAWDLPDSVINRVYGYTRAGGFSHSAQEYAYVGGAVSGGQGIWIRDDSTSSAWQVGYVPTPGSSASAPYPVSEQLDWTEDCRDTPDGVVCNGYIVNGYPETMMGYDTLQETRDRSVVRVAYSTRGDSLYASVEAGTEALQWTNWHPCPNTQFINGYAERLCREYSYLPTYTGSQVYSLPASPPGAANPGMQARSLTWPSGPNFSARSVRWLLTNEDGSEIVLADGVRTGSTVRDLEFSDCRIRWLSAPTGTPLRPDVLSAHACMTRGVGGAAPVKGRPTLARQGLIRRRGLTGRSLNRPKRPAS